MSESGRPAGGGTALYDDAKMPDAVKRRKKRSSEIRGNYLPWTFVPLVVGFAMVFVVRFMLFSPSGASPSPGDTGGGGADPMFFALAAAAVIPFVVVFTLVPVGFMRQALADAELSVRVFPERLLIPPTELGGKKCTALRPEDVERAFWNPKGERILLTFSQTHKEKLYRPVEVRKDHLTDRRAFWEALKKVVPYDEGREMTMKGVVKALEAEKKGQSFEWADGPCARVDSKTGLAEREKRAAEEKKAEEKLEEEAEEAILVKEGKTRLEREMERKKEGADERPSSFMASPPEGPGIS